MGPRKTRYPDSGTTLRSSSVFQSGKAFGCGNQGLYGGRAREFIQFIKRHRAVSKAGNAPTADSSGVRRNSNVSEYRRDVGIRPATIRHPEDRLSPQHHDIRPVDGAFR